MGKLDVTPASGVDRIAPTGAAGGLAYIARIVAISCLAVRLRCSSAEGYLDCIAATDWTKEWNRMIFFSFTKRDFGRFTTFGPACRDGRVIASGGLRDDTIAIGA